MTRQEISIVDKNGKPVKLTGRKKAFVDFLNNNLETDDHGFCTFGKKCKELEGEDSYVPDGDCSFGCGIEKHHYHCASCRGITQIG